MKVLFLLLWFVAAVHTTKRCQVTQHCLEIAARDHKVHSKNYSCDVDAGTQLTYSTSECGKDKPKFEVALSSPDGTVVVSGNAVSNFVIPKDGNYILSITCLRDVIACKIDVASVYTISPPDSPVAIQAEHVTTSSADIVWANAPTSHGARVDAGRVEGRTLSGTLVKCVANLTACELNNLTTCELNNLTTCELNNLVSGTKYRVTVASHNVAGWSAPSPPVTIITPTSTSSATSATSGPSTGTTSGSTTGPLPTIDTQISIYASGNASAKDAFTIHQFVEDVAVIMSVEAHSLKAVSWSIKMDQSFSLAAVPPKPFQLFVEIASATSEALLHGTKVLAERAEAGAVVMLFHLQATEIVAGSLPSQSSGEHNETAEVLGGTGAVLFACLLLIVGGSEYYFRKRSSGQDGARHVSKTAPNINESDSDTYAPLVFHGLDGNAFDASAAQSSCAMTRPRCIAGAACIALVPVAVAIIVIVRVLFTESGENLPVPTAHSPQQPARPFPLSIGTTEIILGWAEPADNGAQISNVIVQAANVSGAFTTISDCGPGKMEALACTVSHLLASTNYRFRIIAQNSAGNSAPSEPALCETSPPVVPSPPVGLKIVTTATHGITLSWKKPEDNGGAVLTSYSVEIAAISGPYHVAYNGTARILQAVLDGLAAEKTYLLRVSAANRVGASVWSTPIKASTNSPNATVPSPPTDLTVTKRHPQAFDLKWLAPPDGGAQITNFIVEGKVGDASSQEKYLLVLQGDVERGRTTTLLTPNTTYSFRVQAINSVGRSAWSTTVTNRTLGPSAPCKMDPPTLVKVAGQSVVLVWTPPACNNGAPITAYSARHNGWLYDKPLTEMYTGTSKTWNSTNLMPASTYSFDVAARNRLGLGLYSDTIKFTTNEMGGCGNSHDLPIFKAQRTSIKKKVKKCGIDNPSSEDKFRECVMRALGLSENCANCYVIQGLCIKDHCLAKCVNPNSAECLACGMKYCFYPLVQCSGIPTCAWPAAPTPCTII